MIRGSIEPGIIAAACLEKYQMVKDKIAEIDKLAGANDNLFRKLILDTFRPDLPAAKGISVGSRY